MSESDEKDFRSELISRLEREGQGPCPDPALLLASQSDAVPEEMRRGVLGHLERCPLCQAVLRDIESPEFAELSPERVKAIRERIPAARQSKRRHWWWGATPLAAGVALALIYFSGLGDRPAEVASDPAVPSPVDPGLRRLPLVQPAIQLPATALLFRGKTEPAANPLIEAVGAFRERKYDVAAARLGALAVKEPETAEVHFYLGVSLLFLDRAEEAVRPLETARRLADARLAREAEWYLAVAHQKRGALPEAVRRIEALCASDGAHREEACTARAAPERR